ncbi:C-C motif chemokine 3-like [Orcinus orca]|uniref:C-C motif chemokine 3-like n=1 Tax=Orcinus orca TaxID=9733 RepID=UPI0021122C31|nr:C-C motif chemokine 3-like [Orcinus orca]
MCLLEIDFFDMDASAVRLWFPLGVCFLRLRGIIIYITAVPSAGDQSVLFLTVGANTPTACCFSYISWQIPCKFMDDYYETSRQCSKPSVIFQTKRGQEVCADPNEDRVQEYITDLELSA